MDNLFSNVDVVLEDFSGAFIYEEMDRTSNDYHTVIRNNLFDKCSSSKQLSIKLKGKSWPFGRTKGPLVF